MAEYLDRIIGNYRLIRLLGEGSFAQVYLGTHIQHTSPAAIKILKAHLKGEASDQFLTEARVIARLRHPHIVRLFEFGIDYTLPYFTMTYAPGGTIRQRHPVGSTLTPTEIILYIRQIASALQYAHDHQVIHRDVKPENILLTANKQILLSDFGLATRAHAIYSEPTVPLGTLPGKGTHGTTTYMAPEQFSNRAYKASDQYALGIIVYEWLCGTPPFTGTDLEISLQHLYSTPPPLRDKLPLLDPAIEAVVMKALAKDPNKRYTHIQDFAQALKSACIPAITNSAAAKPSALVPSTQPLPALRPAPFPLPTTITAQLPTINEVYTDPHIVAIPNQPALSRETRIFPGAHQHPIKGRSLLKVATAIVCLLCVGIALAFQAQTTLQPHSNTSKRITTQSTHTSDKQEPAITPSPQPTPLLTPAPNTEATPGTPANTPITNKNCNINTTNGNVSINCGNTQIKCVNGQCTINEGNITVGGTRRSGR